MRTRRRNYTAATQPSTSLPEAPKVKPIVPTSGTKRIQSCSEKRKGSSKTNKNKCITTELWDRHIPTEILEGILSGLGLKDNIQASAVCKTWCESAVSVRKSPCRPWLLHPTDVWTPTCSPYLLLDPLQQPQSQKYNLNFPDTRFTPGGMSYSRDGWVLAKSSHRMYPFLFNPFTKKLLFLPVGSLYHLTSRLAFSAAPTSTSCVPLGPPIALRTLFFAGGDKCVFSNGVFYFLSTCGCLGVFHPCEATWNLLPVKPFLFPELDSPVFIMEHEGDIFVMCSRLDSNHMVFKLNMKQNVWEEKRDLGGLTVFASVPGSFIRACLSLEEMNRIYPSFTDFYLIYGTSSHRPPQTNLSCRVAWVEPPQNNLHLL
ncbi:hypothetical protein Bca101_024863 [Brassica carinata]